MEKSAGKDLLAQGLRARARLQLPGDADGAAEDASAVWAALQDAAPLEARGWEACFACEGVLHFLLRASANRIAASGEAARYLVLCSRRGVPRATTLPRSVPWVRQLGPPLRARSCRALAAGAMGSRAAKCSSGAPFNGALYI